MKTKNTTLWIVIGIVLIITIIGSLYYSNQQNKQKEEKIRIGLMGPFSGYSAQFGGMIQNGLDLALEELPAETRNKIEIIKEDDMCDSKQGLTAAQKLINVDGVKYVLGPMCNEAVLSTESLFEDNKVVALTIGLPSNSIADMGTYHFSFSPEIEYLMKTVAKKMREENITRVAVIHMGAPFETENYQHFVKYFESEGGIIVADETIVRGSADFRTPLQKVKDAKPEAIFIAAHTGELVNILKQTKELGINDLPKYGIHAAEAPVIITDAADIAEGLIYPYPADKIEIESAKNYAEKYTAKYNFDPDPYSSNTYDSLNILVAAIEKCGYENSDCVLNQLSSIKDYAGANGLLSVDNRGVGTYKVIMLKVVKDGKFQKLE